MSERTQASLRLTRESGEQKGDEVAGMEIAVAGYDDAGAVNFLGVGILQVNGHFCPRGNRFGREEFNPALANFDGIG